MKDQRKGKAELIAELQELRERLSTLEQAQPAPRAGLEQILTLASTRLIALEAGQIDAAIQETLGEVGTFMQVDRSYVFLLSIDGTYMVNTFEWCAPGIKPQIENLQALPANAYAWWMGKLQRFENIHIPRVCELPPEAAAEKEVLTIQGIQSLVVVPIAYSKSLWGFAGFDSVRAERRWQENEIHWLRITADMIANAMARKRAEATLVERNQFVTSLLRAIPVPVFFKDKQGKYLGCNDAFTEMMGVTSEDIAGKTVFELWPGEMAKVYHEKDLELLRNQQHQIYEYQVKDKEGKMRPVIYAKDIFLDANGEAAGLVGAFLDITERLEAESVIQQRARELEIINLASLKLRTITDPIKLLEAVLAETSHAVGAPAGCISLWKPDANGLVQVVASGWLSNFVENPIKPGEGVFGYVFSSGETYVSQELAEDPRTLEESRSQLPIGWGCACVPIHSTTESLGVILLAAPNKRTFDKDEIRLLETLAQITGAALHRMTLYDETAQRAKEFEALYETSQALATEYELDALLKTIVRSAAGLLGAAAGGMYLYDPTGKELEVAISNDPSIPIGTRLKLGEGLAGRVAQSGQPLRVDDYSKWEKRSRKYKGTIVRAVLEVPLRYGGELIGVLVAHEMGRSERKYSQADERLLSLFASQAAGAIKAARLRQETISRLNRLQALRMVDRAIVGNPDLHATLDILLDQVTSQLKVDASRILLLRPPLQSLQFAAGRGFHTSQEETTSIRVGESHAGRAILEHHLVHLESAQKARENPEFGYLWTQEGFSHYYAVPLFARGVAKGVLEVFHRSLFIPSTEWLDFLEALADQAAIAIDNAQLFENLQSANLELSLAYDATIEGWARAMELRDKETEGHSQRVTEMTIVMARAFGIKDEEIVHLQRGALLHDIGKMGIPDQILLKPASLSDEEWIVMRQHPQFAYDMLLPVAYLRRALEIPYSHHERWDGKGYPQGLKGAQIPLAARIFSVVDVFDALTNDRPYRKAWSVEKTLEYIKRQSGKRFDPQVVETFLRLFGSPHLSHC